jgi:hypothetical protein
MKVRSDIQVTDLTNKVGTVFDLASRKVSDIDGKGYDPDLSLTKPLQPMEFHIGILGHPAWCI